MGDQPERKREDRKVGGRMVKRKKTFNEKKDRLKNWKQSGIANPQSRI